MPVRASTVSEPRRARAQRDDAAQSHAVTENVTAPEELARSPWARRALGALTSLAIALGVWSGTAAAPRSAAPLFDAPAWGARAGAARDTVEADTTDDEAIDIEALQRLAEEAAALDALDALGVAARDTVEADSLGAAAPDSNLVDRYLRALYRRDRARYAAPAPRLERPFSPRVGTYWRREVTLDSTETRYRVEETVGRSQSVRDPLTLDLRQYQRARLRSDLRANFYELSAQRARQRQQRSRGGLGLNIVVPGGRNSAFTSIFGKPEVDLRVNGRANIRAGFDYRKSDQQTSAVAQRAQIDPDFMQDLQLGIAGTIGDKMRIQVDWDTERDFDYQNNIKLQYTGYEDEIIQNIEAGNVVLQTPSTLIRAGQSLFGIRADFQIGGINLTTVVSQEEGQSNSLSVNEGAETTNFNIKPVDYEDAQHFFLGYYFRNRWEEALSDPPNVLIAGGFERVTAVEVWRLETRTAEDRDIRTAVALVDLAESSSILTLGDDYTNAVLPTPDGDQYTDAFLDGTLRPGGDANPKDELEALGLESFDFQAGDFKLLQENNDYTIDPILGVVSLNTPVSDNQAIAVAFRYQRNGREVQVGDFAAQGGGSTGGQNAERLVLKLLRPTQLQQPSESVDPAAWYLENRSIYRLPGSGINPNEFDLQIFLRPPGSTETKVIPGVGRSQTMLQLLGLDRLNEDGAPNPDDRFDYLVNYTIDPARGRIVFPYLEPFGQRIEDVIATSGLTPEEAAQARERYVFDDLYVQKPVTARLNTRLDIYEISGSYKGKSSGYYDLGAFAGLIEGSVRVTSGGTPLTEGADYEVDYIGGSVTITNPAYLSAGRDIDIDYEQNSFFNLQQKTLIGARMDYVLADRLEIGTTLMRLTQKSPIDKFRIGEEPVANTIWGFDGSFEAEPRWLTRAVDALPLIQTRAPSRFTITGEFAQLRPDHVETTAFERSRRDLRESGLDFKDDELRGISYIDDFEAFETTFQLGRPGLWRLSAPPDSTAGVGPGERGLQGDSLRSNWRGTFGWYQLNTNTLAQFDGSIAAPPGYDPASIEIVEVTDVFPERDVTGLSGAARQLSTFDVYFNPFERGPYNYTREFSAFSQQPERVWGGMTQRIADGFNDFALKNIEFVEFIFQPFPENGSKDAGAGAKLYVDLGRISEDVVPNGRLNNEDGLSTGTISETSISTWGRLPNAAINTVVDVDDETGRTEDLGLDGLSSVNAGNYPPFATEQAQFADFLDRLSCPAGNAICQAEIAKAQVDPSGDDYHYFGNDLFFANRDFYPQGPTLQQRFSRFFAGQELNSFEAQNELADNTSAKNGNSRFPDSEDLDLNSNVDTENSYYQYELPLDEATLDTQARPEVQGAGDYVVGEITDEDGAGTGWYQVRIPIRDFTRRVGTIQDFTSIQNIRVWTTGHRAPITLRFAELEFVGSQWRSSLDVGREFDPMADTANVSISSVNNEENTNIYAVPPGTVVTQIRSATGGAGRQAREQALVVTAEDLEPGQQRAIFKTFNTNSLDLLRYSNVRMFMHFDGQLADGSPLTSLMPEEARSKATVFVRIGANQTTDYYEYEQPLTPSDPTMDGITAQQLWQVNQPNPAGEGFIDLGSMNLELTALNQLKVLRDELGVNPADVFYNKTNGELVDPAAPEAERFAPPGTRLAIRGNPSLDRVNTIVIGIRNDSTNTETLGRATLWVNELRVAGYDETNGWAAVTQARVDFADVGSLRGSFNARTDGFGSLSSTLAEREQNEIRNWNVTGDLSLDALLPERYGWNLPLTVQLGQDVSTPRFAPNRGDVRLDALLDQVANDASLSEDERAQTQDQIVAAAQTRSNKRSVTASVRKTGSRSKLLRNTIDGVNFSYAWSENERSSPRQQRADQWNWSVNTGYRLSIRKPRTVRPFWLLENVPVLRLLGDLRLNYVPQSVNLTATASRNFSSSKERPTTRADSALRPELIAFPIREQHTLSARRSSAIQYNPFQFLSLSFDLDTNQSLNDLGVETQTSVISRTFTEIGGVKVARDTVYTGITLEQAILDGLVAPGDSALQAFEVEELRVVGAGRTAVRYFSGDDRVRTDRHGQRFSATLRPRFRSQALNWLTLQDISYSASYGWRNGAVGQLVGASVNNQVDVRAGLGLKIQDLFRKIPFYRNLEQADRDQRAEATRLREERRRERERRKEARREEREAQREAQRLREEAEAEAAARGETLPPETGEGDPELPPDAPAPDPDADARPPIPAEINEGEDEAELETPQRPNVPTTRDDVGVDGSSGFRLPFPRPATVFRRLALGVTGLSDLTVTYNGTRAASSSNVGRLSADSTEVETNYSFIDAIRGRGASLGYRFGFDNQLDGGRVFDSNVQVTDAFENRNSVKARTALRPSQSLSITLSWSLDFNDSRTVTFRTTEEDGTFATPNEQGQNRASVWAFGSSYGDVFDRQRRTYLDDNNAGAAVTDTLRDSNQDGRVVLTNDSVVEDFREVYSAGPGTLDGKGFLPFPMPGWQVTYSGLSKLPLLRAVFQSATLSHGYSADYSADYTTNLAALNEDAEQGTYRLAGRPVAFDLPTYEARGVRINQRYSPLVGLNLSWKGQVQTQINLNRSNTYSLSATTFEVSETQTNELSLSASWQKQGLQLPFMKRRLNNRISVNMTATRSATEDVRYNLAAAIGKFAEGTEFTPGDEVTDDRFVSRPTASTRTTLSPQVQYQFSGLVTASMFLKYERFDSEDSRVNSRTNVNGGFNVTVNITSAGR